MVFLSFDGVLNGFQLTAFLVSQSMLSSIVVGQPVYYRKQLLNAAICFFGFTYHMMRNFKKLHRKLLQTITGPSSSTEVQRGPEETITVHKWILEKKPMIVFGYSYAQAFSTPLIVITEHIFAKQYGFS